MIWSITPIVYCVFKHIHSWWAKLHPIPVIRSFLMDSRLHIEAPQITCHHQAEKPSTILNNPTSSRVSPIPLKILISGWGPKQGRFTVRFPASSLRTCRVLNLNCVPEVISHLDKRVVIPVALDAKAHCLFNLNVLAKLQHGSPNTLNSADLWVGS